MANPKTKSPIDLAALELRKMALALPEGAFLGSEDELVARLGVARVTVRQAARLLEREGLLFVRRGIKGGYFASRPNAEMLESVFCAYLETLELDTRHTGNVTTALWTEVLREAAGADPDAVKVVVAKLAPLIDAVDANAGLEVVADVQKTIRTTIFALIEGSYIELLFRINTAFSRQQLVSMSVRLGDEANRRFVERWKQAVHLELQAISTGDAMLAMSAALHGRSVWLDRAKN